MHLRLVGYSREREKEEEGEGEGEGEERGEGEEWREEGGGALFFFL